MRTPNLSALCRTAFHVAALTLSVTLFAATLVAADKAHEKGEKAIRKGDYQAAEKIFRELLGKDSKDNEARLGLSLALLKQRSLQGAYDHAE